MSLWYVNIFLPKMSTISLDQTEMKWLRRLWFWRSRYHPRNLKIRCLQELSINNTQWSKSLIFLEKVLVGTCLLFWGGGGHWFPCFGFLVTSPLLGFKARVGSALFAFFAEANAMQWSKSYFSSISTLHQVQPEDQIHCLEVFNFFWERLK